MTQTEYNQIVMAIAEIVDVIYDYQRGNCFDSLDPTQVEALQTLVDVAGAYINLSEAKEPK